MCDCGILDAIVLMFPREPLSRQRLPPEREKEAACTRTPAPHAMLINLQSEERRTPEAD